MQVTDCLPISQTGCSPANATRFEKPKLLCNGTVKYAAALGNRKFQKYQYLTNLFVLGSKGVGHVLSMTLSFKKNCLIVGRHSYRFSSIHVLI